MIGRALLREQRNRIGGIARIRFNEYDRRHWEHTYFDYRTGGYLVTERDRFKELVPDKHGAEESRTEQTFREEREAAMRYAKWGFQIEHLANRNNPGGNPDARLRRKAPNIRVNGILADIKTITSPSKFTRRVNEAYNKNGAQFAMMRLLYPRNEDNETALNKSIRLLQKENRHGCYYFEGENQFYWF